MRNELRDLLFNLFQTLTLPFDPLLPFLPLFKEDYYLEIAIKTSLTDGVITL